MLLFEKHLIKPIQKLAGIVGLEMRAQPSVIPPYETHILAFRCRMKLPEKMTDIVEDDMKLDENHTELDFATPEKQEARAYLRERFLRVITGIVGKKAEFYLHENTRVHAEFRGCDIDFLEVYVRNLETPLGNIPEAVLRANDIIHMDVKDINTVQ